MINIGDKFIINCPTEIGKTVEKEFIVSEIYPYFAVLKSDNYSVCYALDELNKIKIIEGEW